VGFGDRDAPPGRERIDPENERALVGVGVALDQGVERLTERELAFLRAQAEAQHEAESLIEGGTVPASQRIDLGAHLFAELHDRPHRRGRGTSGQGGGVGLRACVVHHRSTSIDSSNMRRPGVRPWSRSTKRQRSPHWTRRR
jgi:hypothetical protein